MEERMKEERRISKEEHVAILSECHGYIPPPKYHSRRVPLDS
jgi:hypothetical protein